jgi:phenylalanyl-tRNA synthetase beta chain
MKFSYNWLKELSGTKKSPEQLAELLTMKAFEVEGIEKIGGGLDNVVVAKILEITKHPNADKLSLVELTTNNEQQTRIRVVCGASNIKVGDRVPLALVGAKLPNGFEIKEAEIRGVKSSGMLCAEDELGLGDDHGGILILDKDDNIGTSVAEALGLIDTVLEIKILPDRSHDAMSHIGMAREICVIDGRELKYNYPKLTQNKSKILNVKIKDEELCPRYIGVVMNNIKIAPSPMWAQTRLRAAGLRPINNIVDATNYVMLEFGQPMHAFDVSMIKEQGSKINIIVRRAENGEEIRLLDETEKELASEDLVIADNTRALALAGIMGGIDSGINEKTTSIVLESANFNAVAIRKTRLRLNLQTDASIRFEKEIDPNLTELAMARAVQIITGLGGKVEGVADVYPSEVKPWKIKLDLYYVNKLLGEKVPVSAVKKILTSLGLKVSGLVSQISVTIPTFRIDLKTQEDLIEEIGRIYGYEKIVPEAPHVPVKMADINEERKFDRLVKNILTGKGFSEVYSYSFYSQHDANLANFGDLKHLELENPASPEQALMRISLIPQILKNVRENLKRYKEVFVFEIGRVFWMNNNVLPEEKRMLVGAIHTDRKINIKRIKQETNFYETKGYVDALLEMLGVGDYYFDSFESVPTDTPLALWHEGRTAAIKIEGVDETIGYIGEISPLVLANFDISKRVAIFELDLDKLQKVTAEETEYAPIRKYPDIMRDISMVSQKGILVDEILQAIQKAGGDLVLDVDLFDIFDFEDGTSSYAFHIIFGADRTLKNEEVDKLMEKIIQSLEKELKMKVRK